ncbi:MAG TPA: alpha/beta hydrolase [Gemmatimonadetes bacterium]|nr:alpha/beta hydrolase [Gemmatimonadota bacterium]
MLMIHGYGASAFSWRYWAPRLAQRAHVVLVDLKGSGAAPKPDDGEYRPEDQAELLHRLVVQRDLRRLTIVGHSLGGGIALLLALRLQDEDEGRLSRLVLVASAAYEQRLPPFVGLARFRWLGVALFRLFGARLVIEKVLRSIMYDPRAVSAEQVEGYAAPLDDAPARRALIDSALNLVPEEIDALNARFSELAVPALILWGRHDRVVPLWVGERLCEALPKATLHVFEACGHLPAEEIPEESLARLTAFLDETVAR